jgi:iron complex outermembrane receptor protein
MKPIITIIGFLISVVLIGQEQLEDTINIPEVTIQSVGTQREAIQQIPKELMELPSNPSLAELIGKHSPIFVKSYGIGSLATVSMRGSGASHTAILWNGISLNSSMNGLVDLSLYPSFFIDEANVSFGTSSLSKTSGGIGGAIELENKLPKKSKDRILLNQQLGSFGLQSTQLSLNLNKGKWYSSSKVYYKTVENNFIYKNLAENGFPEKKLENASLEQIGLKQDVFFKKNETVVYGAQLWYYNSERNLPSIYTVNNVDENQVDESFRAFVNAKYYFNKGEMELKTALLNDKVEYENKQASIYSKSSSISSKSLIEWEQKIKNNVIWQSNFNIEFNQAEQQAFTRTLIQNRLAWFNQLSIDHFKNIVLSIAARKELIIGKDLYFLPTADINYKIPRLKLALNYKLGKNLKYPSLNDLYWNPGGNSELDAEESLGNEIGVNSKLLFFNKKLEIKSMFSVFQYEIDNYILWRPSSLGYWEALNVKNVTSKGVELNIEHRSEYKNWNISGFFNYAYTSSLSTNKEHEFDNSVNKQLIYVPEHKMNYLTKIDFNNFSFSYNYQFIGARYTTTDNIEFLPYYTISDFTIEKQFEFKKQELAISFSILNAFDLEYQAIQWRPMPGRNFLINLKYKLHAK